jgi:hypothetical protein
MRAIEPLTRTTDEIVREIVQTLQSDQVIEPVVRLLVDGLRQLHKYGPLSGYRKDNREFARKIKRWSEDGEKIFAKLPENFNVHMLFAPEDCGPLNTPERIEAMARQAEAGYGILKHWLTTLKFRCEWVIRSKIGEHRHAGYQQERVAVAARELCEKAGKPLAWSSPTSAYRIVAGLLYETMTGEQGRDMERACEFIAGRQIIQTEKV